MTSGHLASQRAEGDKTVSLHESPPQGLARQAIRSYRSSEPTAVRPRPAVLSLRLRNEIPPLLEPRDARVARTRSHQTRFILDVVRLLNTVAVQLESEFRQSACLSSVGVVAATTSSAINKSTRAEKVRSFDSLSSLSPSEILSLSSSRVASPPGTRPYTRAGQFVGVGSGQILCRNEGGSCASFHSYSMMQVTHRPAATSKGHRYQQIVVPVQNKHTQPGPITKEELDRIVKSAKEIIVAPKDMAPPESVHLPLHLPGDLDLSYDVSEVHPVLDRRPHFSSQSIEVSSVSTDRQHDEGSAPPPFRSRVSSKDKEVPLALDTRQYFEQANAHLFHLDNLDTPSTIELFGQVSPAAYGDRVTQLRRRESWDAVSPLSAHNSPIQDSSSFQVSARSSLNSPPSQSSSSDYRRSPVTSSHSQFEILPRTSYANSVLPVLNLREGQLHSRSVSENITSSSSNPSRTQKRMHKHGRSIMGPPVPPPTGPLPPLPEKRGLITFFRRRSQVSLKELIVHPPQSYRLERELKSSKSTNGLSKGPEFNQLGGLNIRSSPLSSGISTPMANTPSQRKTEVELPPQVTQRMKKTQELRQRDISRMRGRKSANSLQKLDETEATKTGSSTPQGTQNINVSKNVTNDADHAQLQSTQQEVPPLRPRKDPRRMAGSDPLSVSTARLDQKISNVYDDLTGYIFPYMSTSPSKDNQLIRIRDYAVSPITPIELPSKDLSSNSSVPITPIRSDQPMTRSRPKTPVSRPAGPVKEYAPLESIGAPSPPRPKTPLTGSLKSSPGSASVSTSAVIASSLPQYRPERIEKLEVGGIIPPPTSKRGTQSSDESLFQRIDAGDVLLMMEDLEVRITKKFEKRMRGLEQRVAIVEQLVVESLAKI